METERESKIKTVMSNREVNEALKELETHIRVERIATAESCIRNKISNHIKQLHDDNKRINPEIQTLKADRIVHL